MKTGWWKINYTIEPDSNDLQYIANLIQQGFTEVEIIQADPETE